MNLIDIKFSHKEKNGDVIKIYFIIEVNKKQVSFYTFTDLSGYGIDFAIEIPEEFIFIGTAILSNKDQLKQLIKDNI